MLYGFFYIYNCQRRDYITFSPKIQFYNKKTIIKSPNNNNNHQILLLMSQDP